MPENEASGDDDSQAVHDRETMRAALNGMSVDQLQELRSTIIQLKHLPFTKLVETLFTQQALRDGEDVSPSQIYRDDHAFVQDSGGHYESRATRELCEDVETILKARVGKTN